MLRFYVIAFKKHLNYTTMSKHKLIKEETKAQKLKKALPSNYATQLSKMAIEHNKNLTEEDQKLPTNRVTISHIVRHLQIDHPIWPLVEELSEKFLAIRRQREERLDQLLSA